MAVQGSQGVRARVGISALLTEGSRLVTESGDDFTFRAVKWFGMETSNCAPGVDPRMNPDLQGLAPLQVMVRVVGARPNGTFGWCWTGQLPPLGPADRLTRPLQLLSEENVMD